MVRHRLGRHARAIANYRNFARCQASLTLPRILRIIRNDRDSGILADVRWHLGRLQGKPDATNGDREATGDEKLRLLNLRSARK